MTGQQRSRSGHRAVPHTADLRLEAWAATTEGCIRKAFDAVVQGFVDTSGARPAGERVCALTAGSDEDLLVSVLEEVI